MSSNSQQSQLDRSLANLLPKQLEAKDGDLQKYYEQFKTSVTRKALLILTETIPNKIKQFNELQPIESLPGEAVSMSNFPEDEIYKVPHVKIDDSMEVEVNAKGKRVRTEHSGVEGALKLPKYIYTTDTSSNNLVAEKVHQVKRDAAELLELVASVKLWIQLNIPKIEDGNNFGVAIQEDVIQELSRVEDAAFALRDSTSKYFCQRAKLITKVIKYPNVEDYRITLRELDEKQWFQMKITNMDTRNNYAIIYDMLHKNWQKVIKPRSNDGNMMVY